MNALENQFFDGFSTEGRDALLGHLRVEKYDDAVYLFHEGDPADGVCLVVEGEVEVLKAAGNREQVLGIFHPGEFMGEAAVLDEHGRSTCARARGQVVIVKVPTDPLLEVLTHEPVALTMKLFQQVLTYFRRTNDLFVREVVHKEKLALVGEMAGSLMHDLRNPLAGVRLGADLLGMIHHDDESVRCCDVIRIQCDRVVAMATDLLEVSKGEVKLRLRRTNTASFLQQFKSLNEEYFRHTTATINFEAEPAEIEIDSMRLLRLIQNLVTNSVEAIGTAEGGQIDVCAWVKDAVLNISVSDNGPGIPESILSRMFEPFATYGKKGGTGLGMAIVKNVVQAHHGTITFQTAERKGTSFLIQLPQFAPPSHLHVHEEADGKMATAAAAPQADLKETAPVEARKSAPKA